MEEEEEGAVVLDGLCVGGPLDGRIWASRFPSGFLVVDKPRNLAWVYDWAPEAERFVVREAAGAPLDTDRRWLAADEHTYDVVAYDVDWDREEQV